MPPIASVAERKNKLECFDCLLTSLEKSETPAERKTLFAALVKSTGVNYTPESFESLGPTIDAIERWRDWRKKQK